MKNPISFKSPFFDVQKSGDYVMVIANCDDDGFGIITLGNMEWKSAKGYLVSDVNIWYFVLESLSSIRDFI